MGRIIILFFFFIGFLIYSLYRYARIGLSLGKEAVFQRTGLTDLEQKCLNIVHFIMSRQIEIISMNNNKYIFHNDRKSLCYYYSTMKYFLNAFLPNDEKNRHDDIIAVLLRIIINDETKYQLAVQLIASTDEDDIIKDELFRASEYAFKDVKYLILKEINIKTLERVNGLIKLQSDKK